MQIKDFIKTHQEKFVLVTGYLIVASLAFGLGHFTAPKFQESKLGQTANLPSNYSPNVSGAQTQTATQAAAVTADASLNCNGKIKGSSSMIYHLPGGAFYEKTTKPIRCFNTEAEAQAAGFRKSSK